MKIGIVQQSGIFSLDRQKINKHNIICSTHSTSSDTVSFKGATEIDTAEKIVKRYTRISGGLGLILAQVIGVDSASLVANNVCMIRSIAKKAYMSKLDKSEMKNFITGASLSAVGLKTAAGPLTLVPVVGNIVNSAISAGITKTVGTKFIKLCEKKLS